MNDYMDKIVRPDARLEILSALLSAPEYTANIRQLGTALDARGARIGTTDLRADLEWLRDHELLTLETESDLWLAELRERGVDVARGRALCEGVTRPTARP